jgi:hypothetical protein
MRYFSKTYICKKVYRTGFWLIGAEWSKMKQNVEEKLWKKSGIILNRQFIELDWGRFIRAEKTFFSHFFFTF